MSYDNCGTLWPTANFNNPDAKCHYSGDAKIDGKDYKLFGRKVGKRRDFSINGHGVKGACSLSPVDSASEKSPDFKGKTMIQGEELEVAAWGKVVQTKHGETKSILSLKFQPPYQPKENPERQQKEEKDQPPENFEVGQLHFVSVLLH